MYFPNRNLIPQKQKYFIEDCPGRLTNQNDNCDYVVMIDLLGSLWEGILTLVCYKRFIYTSYL